MRERRPHLDPDGRAVMHNGFVDDPERQCKGKQSYTTKARGKKALARFKGTTSIKGRRRSEMHVYRCPHCNYFHLGTKV